MIPFHDSSASDPFHCLCGLNDQVFVSLAREATFAEEVYVAEYNGNNGLIIVTPMLPPSESFPRLIDDCLQR